MSSDEPVESPDSTTVFSYHDLSPHERMETFAEGLATSAPFALTTEVLSDGLADFLTVVVPVSGRKARRSSGRPWTVSRPSPVPSRGSARTRGG